MTTRRQRLWILECPLCGSEAWVLQLRGGCTKEEALDGIASSCCLLPSNRVSVHVADEVGDYPWERDDSELR